MREFYFADGSSEKRRWSLEQSEQKWVAEITGESADSEGGFDVEVEYSIEDVASFAGIELSYEIYSESSPATDWH